MKTSFIIAWACLFISCIMFNSIVELNTGMDNTQMNWLNNIIHPTGVESAINDWGVIGEIAGFVTMVWSYFVTLISMIMLYFPSMWNGVWLWVYFVVFLPVSIGFIVSIVIILKGGNNT